MLVELDLRLLLSFSRKLVAVKNNIETCFFWKEASKSGCTLYMGKYGTCPTKKVAVTIFSQGGKCLCHIKTSQNNEPLKVELPWQSVSE